jgi:hypothetical protein
MKKKWLFAGFGLALIVVLTLAATTDRHVGGYIVWTCNPTDMIASQTDTSLGGQCEWDAPMKLYIDSIQIVCDAEANGAKDIEFLEGGVVGGAASLDVADDPVFFTMTDTVIDDEDEIGFQYTTAATETTTTCQISLMAMPG